MANSDNHGDDVRVAVLGTGIMGSAMARRLVAAGLPTTVWDRSPAATAPLGEAGAVVAPSAADAAGAARVVITMLPTADVLTSVVFGGGAAAALTPGAVWAQMGTIGVAATAEIAGLLGQQQPDVLFVDAPVSGSKGPAESGQLLILASGPPAAQAIVSPAFSAIGRKTVWLGEAGQGTRMKLIVNAYMSVLIEGVAEALELAGLAGDRSRQARRDHRGRAAGRADRRRQAPQDGTGRLRARVPAGMGAEGRGPGARRGQRGHTAPAGRDVPAVARGRGRRARPRGRQRRAPGPG